MTQTILQRWQKDRLHTTMVWCWYATVLTSFWGSTVISLAVPPIGELFPFRVFLPITALLYVVWAVRTREFVWGELSFLEKMTYLLAVIMVVYGVVSLPRAMNLWYTGSILFNLCFDIVFFLLFLRLCRYQDIRKTTIRICLAMLAILLALGVYEVFFGGIWNRIYDHKLRFTFFHDVLYFPSVFSYNTNDYASCISFLFSVLLMWKLDLQDRWNRRSQVGVVLAGIFSYFVLNAANGRLALAAFACALVGGFLSLWIGKRSGRIWVTVLLIIGLIGVEFANRYYYVMPQIESYIQDMITQPAPVPPDGATSGTESEPDSPPSIDFTRPNSETVTEEIFTTDEETGETVLREDSSGGVRLRLILHAGRCFLESYGLGVGVGNTSRLAQEKLVTGESGVWDIHCFVARIIGDYGLFVLVPLALIGLSLLKSVYQMVWSGIQRKDRRIVAYGILFLFVLMSYPFASTSSSDAQNIIPMWIYLGFVVLEANRKSSQLRE